MSGDLVLDTSVVIAALRGVSGIEARLDQAERLWLPVIALGELELGVELRATLECSAPPWMPFCPPCPCCL